MKYLLAILFVLLCTSCVSINHHKNYKLIVNAPVPPVLDRYCTRGACDYIKYADDLNGYMAFLYAYTKGVNEHALSEGWTIPEAPPLCRLVSIPIPGAFPVFSPNKNNTKSKDFEWELTKYIKTLRSIYSHHRVELKNAETLQRSMCVYE